MEEIKGEIKIFFEVKFLEQHSHKPGLDEVEFKMLEDGSRDSLEVVFSLVEIK